MLPIELPADLLIELLIVTLGSLLASFINAAFATGGIYIILATSSMIFPLTVAIPLQSAFAFASLASRIVYFWSYIHWPIVTFFVLGSALGVAFGSSVFVALPESMIALLLGPFLLLLIWGPSLRAAKKPSSPDLNKTTKWTYKHVFLPIGVAHSFLATIFGVGTLLQPTILRTSLKKLQITGTLAACLLSMDVFKLTGYVAHGFDYRDYWLHIVCATLAGFIGTLIGKRVTHHVSEHAFRLVFKCLITLVAIRLIFRGLALL